MTSLGLRQAPCFHTGVLNAEVNEHICMGRGNRTHYVGRRFQRPGEAVAIAAMQLDPTKWYFQVDRTGSQISKNFMLKSVYSTKFWEDQKLGWGVEGLAHGHLDNLKTSCFVLTLFQMSYVSPLCFKMKGHFYVTKVDCFHQKHLELSIFYPQLGTD